MYFHYYYSLTFYFYRVYPEAPLVVVLIRIEWEAYAYAYTVHYFVYYLDDDFLGLQEITVPNRVDDVDQTLLPKFVRSFYHLYLLAPFLYRIVLILVLFL